MTTATPWSLQQSQRRLSAPEVGDHFVHFYEDDRGLLDVLLRFVRAGLDAGEPTVVIATPDHQRALIEALDGPAPAFRGGADRRDANIHHAVSSGQLVLLDARVTLSRFMMNGVPNPELFSRMLDSVLMRATKGDPNVRVRAYGEMVDVLWRDGQQAAAIMLEELWNEAAMRHAFALLCSYVMSNFYSVGFEEVCRVHNHVLSLVPPASASPTSDSASELAAESLKERIWALELENQRLREVEGALRRSMSERLRQGEDRFRLLVESVKDYAIIILDPDGGISSWNAGAERIKGYAAKEVIGRHFSELYPPEEVAAGKCERAIETALRDGRHEDEGWRLCKDGSRFWAHVVITTLRNPGGEVIGFANVTRDLTERVEAERERARLARAEEAERRKDDFLAIVGHELRNPLASLSTATFLMRERGGSATEKEMSIIDRQLRQMSKIVGDLLDGSRALQGKVDLTLKTMEIAEVLASAVELASSTITAHRHLLVNDFPSHGLAVQVDPERMAQVFDNLLQNAAKYTPAGGSIRLHAERVGEQVCVTIEDDGQGIDPSALHRIFDLFVQTDTGAQRRDGGLGVGLAVARSLVEAHGGTIAAHSDGIGRGSRFVVRLPVART